MSEALLRHSLVGLAALALAGCPAFHAGRVPNAPADATFVSIDGVDVRYRETGAGPAVVLLHGYGASADAWGPVQPHLARNHRVIAVDLKGFGYTSRPEGDYSPAAQAQLVWQVLDKLGVTDVAIVGHSWGSSVALSMAVARPERTRRVALYAAYVYDEQVPSFLRWSQKSGLGEVLFSLFYRERIEDRATLAYYDERWVTQPRVDRVEADLDLPGTTAAALATARGHHFAALHESLKSFRQPVLLLWGEDDQVTPVKFGVQLERELANARLVTYSRCGHIPMVEAQAPSTRDLAAFLAADIVGTGDAPNREPGDAPDAARPPEQPALEPGTTEDGAGTGGGGGGGSGGVIASSGGPATGRDLPRPAAGARRAANRVVATGIDGLGGSTPEGEPSGPAPSSATRGVSSTSANGPWLSISGGAGPGVPPGADLALLGAELTPRQFTSPRDKTEIVIRGLARVRETGLFNLDLDRGLDSTGQPLFPVPLDGGQKLDSGDIRIRTDVAIYARGVGVAIKGRIDWLDNVALGGDPDLANGSPATASGQRPSVAVVKRGWAEALTPLGTIAAGRMGTQFGLGIAANSGDCLECDRGDAADRIAFVTPIAGHLWAVAWDVASRTPFTTSKDGSRPIALEPMTSAGGVTAGFYKLHTPTTLARRQDAGRASLEYAAYLSLRSQDRDVPASYLPTAAPRAGFTADDLVARGFSALATGGWLRLTGQRFRVEAEVAYAQANIDQPSLIPGVELTQAASSRQLGMALESSFLVGPANLGFDAGFASGDDAPGFGAFPQAGDTAPAAGALDGPQASFPGDTTVDNYRFHPDYKIDQILFRQIIGTVTDAVYLRPHAHVTLVEAGESRIELGGALVASWANQATSTPGNASYLGVELDPELRYVAYGFIAGLHYGLFLPGPAFDSTTLDARPAQSLRLQLSYLY